MFLSWIILCAVYSVSFDRFMIQLFNLCHFFQVTAEPLSEECKKKFNEYDPSKCGALVMVEFPEEISKNCREKFPKKICEIFSCGFESTNALNDGTLAKEQFLAAFELGIASKSASNKEILIPLLPKAFEACETLSRNCRK